MNTITLTAEEMETLRTLIIERIEALANNSEAFEYKNSLSDLYFKLLPHEPTEVPHGKSTS